MNKVQGGTKRWNIQALCGSSNNTVIVMVSLNHCSNGRS